MNNEKLKKDVSSRAKKVGRKTRQYVEKFLLGKIDQAGNAAGAWVENLEAKFDKLKPEGAMRGFSEGDFDDLYFVLTGKKRKKGASRVARLASRVATHPLDIQVESGFGFPMPENNYHRKVFSALWQIFEREKAISEKDFQGQDWIRDECDRVVRTPEAEEIIRRFEAGNYRPEYCAECVFSEVVQAR